MDRRAVSATTFASIDDSEAARIVNRVYENYAVPIDFNAQSIGRFFAVNDIIREASIVWHRHGEVLCAALLGVRRERAWLGAFGVAPPFRGTGVARAFIADVTAAASLRSLRSLRLEVLAENTAAIRTYRAAGFEVRRRLISFASRVIEPRSHDGADFTRHVSALLARGGMPEPSWQAENASIVAMSSMQSCAVGESFIAYFERDGALNIFRAKIADATAFENLVAAIAHTTGARTATMMNVDETAPAARAARRAGWATMHVQHEMVLALG